MNRRQSYRWLLMCILAMPATVATAETQNVILVTMDGFRWQELFTGADRRLMTKEDGGVEKPEELRALYDRDTHTARREALMPFFWSTVARGGQVVGDPDHDSSVVVTNKQQFSYPGYNELLCGFADPEVTSNDKINNKNVTVLEWLHRKPKYAGKVAVFASWDVFPFIVNTKRSGVYVNAGWQPLEFLGNDQFRDQANQLADQLPHYWSAVRYDAFTFQGALAYLSTKQPRVLYVALGETDDWAHAGRYDLYLDAARKNDQFIRQLWETAQSMPQYQDKTTLILTTDHGRGDGREGWKNHSVDTPGSDRMWAGRCGTRHSRDGGPPRYAVDTGPSRCNGRPALGRRLSQNGPAHRAADRRLLMSRPLTSDGCCRGSQTIDS